jgi:2-oxo-hept-3-ene-1,7-dioate hydratase
MTPQDHEEAASELFKAEQDRKQIGLLSLRHPGMTMDDAYAVQSALVEQKMAAGRTVIGWKIGLTSKAMQYALGIDIPDSGVLFDDMAFAHKSRVAAGHFIQPRIEAEIAFKVHTSLQGEVTREDVIAATEFVAPSIEILDTRILRADPETGRARNVCDTISDNAANAGIVLGPQRHKPDDFDLRWVGSIVSRNDEVEETGLGAGVLNDPVAGIVWLVRRLALYGQKVDAGQIVLSGSFIRPVECPSGSHILADFGPFGEVEIGFD